VINQPTICRSLWSSHDPRKIPNLSTNVNKRFLTPLFSRTPMANDRKTPKRRPMSQQSILDVVKKYARQAGIQVDRLGRRSVCIHTLRKTAINNALEHGAKVDDVQQSAGHADLRTTQEYIAYSEKGAEEAARQSQIR